MARELKATQKETDGTGQRPIMALLELLERRWALRIIWELRGDRLTSRQLRERCNDLSPTVLQTRVDELRASGLVDLEARAGYGLTGIGRELLQLFMPLYYFAERWVARDGNGPTNGRSRSRPRAGDVRD